MLRIVKHLKHDTLLCVQGRSGTGRGGGRGSVDGGLGPEGAGEGGRVSIRDLVPHQPNTVSKSEQVAS